MQKLLQFKKLKWIQILRLADRSTQIDASCRISNDTFFRHASSHAHGATHGDSGHLRGQIKHSQQQQNVDKGPNPGNVNLN